MNDEVSKSIQEAAKLYSLEGIEFQVVAKIRAVRPDGKVVDELIQPILLYDGPSLYRAMFLLGTACEVPEFMPSPDELGPAARQIVEEIREGKFKWQKPKESK